MSEEEYRKKFEKTVRDYKVRNFGSRYADKHLGQIRWDLEDQVKLSKYMANPKNFLVICGPPGSSKTHACAGLTDWILSNFQTFRYWKESVLLQRLRRFISDGDGDYLIELKYLTDDQHVILDDIGADGYKAFEETVLFNFLDNRYNDEVPTVLTSNYSRAEFERLYEGRVTDRIFATENIIIDLEGTKSMRQQGV